MCSQFIPTSICRRISFNCLLQVVLIFKWMHYFWLILIIMQALPTIIAVNSIELLYQQSILSIYSDIIYDTTLQQYK